MRQLQLLLYLIILLVSANAVKIGISKIETTTTTTTTTKTTPIPIPNSTDAVATVTLLSGTTNSYLTASTAENNDFTTTLSTINATTDFPILPTRKTKIIIYKKRTTTTTTTSTEMPSTTTTTANANEIPADKLNQTTVTNNNNNNNNNLQQNFYCACNLQQYVCDINCCCDADCSAAVLKVFNCHLEPKHTHLRTRLEDFQYQHGLPSCKINDGWLCVFRTNVKPEKIQPLKHNYDSTVFYKWPNSLLETIETHEDELDYYKFDEPLKLLNMDSLELQNFELPNAFKPPHCHIKEPIRHLRHFKSSCLNANVSELAENTRQILKLTLTTKLLARPIDTYILQDMEQVSQNLVELKIRKCSTKCYDIKSDTNATELVDLTNDNIYGTKIVINIMHNFTQIQKLFIELHAQELQEFATSDKNDDNIAVDLWQIFEVNFLHENETAYNATTTKTRLEQVIKERPVSGVLGYLPGEPVIVATFVPNDAQQQNAQDQQKLLNYFHTNDNDNYTKTDFMLNLFTKRQNLCYKDVDNKLNYISYGINTMKSCKLIISEKLIKQTTSAANKRNYTAICLLLQKEAWQKLFSTKLNFEQLNELQVSQLGKPANTSTKWTPLHLKNYEYTKVNGEYDDISHSFTCRNILLNIAYEFYVGNFIVEGVANQALIKHATLTFGQRNDLEFNLTEVIEVPLMVSVMFYDLNNDVAIMTNGAMMRSSHHFFDLNKCALMLLFFYFII